MKHQKSWPARAALVALVGLVGCAQPGGGAHFDLGHGRDQAVTPADDLGGTDLSQPGDGSTRPPSDGAISQPDLKGVDLAGSDLLTPCTLLPQSGCSAGEKCTFSSSGNVCAADGTVMTGAVCGASGADDCIQGDACINEGTTPAISTCRVFCAADTDCKQPAQAGIPSNVSHCLITLKGVSQKMCTFACQPVTAAGASGCATGLACQVFGATNIPQASDCGAPGTGTDGSDCTTNGVGDCSAGFTCVAETPAGGGTAQNHCRKVCRSGNSADCTGLGGYTCQTPSGTGPFPWGFCEP